MERSDFIFLTASQARKHIPMTMADWALKLDAFLQFNDAEIGTEF